MTKIVGIALTFAAALSAQSYNGNTEGTNCGTISGWAWDSTQPNSSINVDFYDNGVPLVSITANIFRQDLLNAGIGNGVHGFSLATPGSLKDGHAHTVTLYFGGTANYMGGGGNGVSITCTGGTGYQYYNTDALTSINTNNWTQNGVGSAGSSGYTSSDANGGSLISKVAVPDGSSNYEVKMKLSLAASGGTYVTYLRATSNALAANGNTGTFYAVEVQNPTFTQNGAACTATLLISRSVAGSVTTLWGSTIACHSVMAVRTVVNTANNYILVYVDNRCFGFAADSSIQAGKPGVGVIGAPAGNVIAEADLGPIDGVVPQPINPQSMTTSSFANRVDFAWQGAADDPNGTGVAFYWVFRNGAYVGEVPNATYADSTVSPGTTYTYSFMPVDFHANAASGGSYTVTTPPAGTVDPRQVGVRPTGTYWGAAGEQIDLRSGNLNFRLPLVKAAGRGGSGFALGLSYNSSNWRQDPGGTWQLGHDVGYGYGWKLQAGSILPVYSDWMTVHHYVFTDAGGAEYRLDQNTNGVWTSKEAIYASYDTSTQRLYFPDGTFWFFGAVSAGTEQDAGTLYPTQFQDTNGNQILLRYGTASGLPWTGSSARVVQVEDVRAVSQGSGVYASYNFNYNTDGIPHLTSIANTIGTAETYTFTRGSQTLTSPFNSTTYGPWTTLASVKQTGTGQTTSFQYDGSGGLTQMNTPFGGYLRWAYGNGNYTGSILQRDVQNRYLVKASGSPETAYPITRIPGNTLITDPGGQGQKSWSFQTDTTQFNYGLLVSFGDRQMPGPVSKLHNDYTWVQDSAGNPYLGTTVSILQNEPGQSVPIRKKTTQTLDTHGNVTQIKLWDYYTGTPPTNPARTYTNTYLTDNGGCSFSSLYIFNRLTQSTLTDGTNTTTLVTNQYGSIIPADAAGVREHDPNYNTSYLCRGNLTSSTTPSGTTTTGYDIAGNVAWRWVNGELTTNTVSSSTNYAVPSAMTTINLTSSINYTPFLAPSSTTGPNGESASINYDTLARPQSRVSPYGAITTYAYNDTAPATRTATTNGHWTRTTLDGFGRIIKTEIGDAGGTKSTVDTVYDSCGCNPMGKKVKRSMPYAPNGTVYWKQYTYDGLGRTVSATEADGTSTTSYAYLGNTVQVTDPAGKWKKFTMDAFGNLTSVLEPDPLNQPSGTLTTTYARDILNHLTTVTMPRATGTQARTFNYTTGTTVGTLLLSATNPENGTVTYTYNTDKTLATKTDALNQQFSYTYDGYKRVTQINLGQTVIRQFYYDTNPLDSTGTFSQYANGRLTGVQSAPTTHGDTFIEMYSYTQPGQRIKKRLRLSRSVQSHTVTGDLDAQYSYDNEGKMTSVTYPQSYYIDPNTLQALQSPVTTYTYGFDTMGRPTSMTGPGADVWGNPTTVSIVNNVQYGPSSEMLQVSYFGATETRQYNTRLEMTQLTVPGQLNISYNFASSNNGQISSQTDNLSGEQITYQYDALKRLYSASGSAWSQTFTYDGFGNLTDKVGTGTAPTNHSPVNAATNQLTGSGYYYDANGNLITTGFGWDPENRMSYANAGAAQYAYDSKNKRVWAGNFYCTSDYCDPNYTSGWQLNSETIFFYGIDGKRLASYTPKLHYVNGTQSIYYVLSEERVYFKSKYIGNADPTLSSGGTAVGQDRAGSVGKYFPYGEDRSGAPNDTVKFATYTRDSATGLDYADQRYYNYGRFLSADVSGTSGQSREPQSWNRYLYALNDPVNVNDPTGSDYCILFEADDTSCLQWSTGCPAGETLGYLGGSEGGTDCVPDDQPQDGGGPTPECSIQVFDRPLEPLNLNIPGARHGYIIFTEQNGQTTVFEGIKDAEGNNKANTGPFAEASLPQDKPFQNNNRSDGWWKGTEVCDWLRILLGDVATVNSADSIPWKPFGPNSSSVLRYMLESLPNQSWYGMPLMFGYGSSLPGIN